MLNNMCMVSNQEWQDTIKDKKKSLVVLALEHHKVPGNLYSSLRMKTRNEQGQMAQLLCQQTGVPTDRPAAIHKIQNFEEVLNVQICVMSARRGNKIIWVGTNKPEKIYLYLVDNEDSTEEEPGYFHAITSITGFLPVDKYCDRCNKGYICGKKRYQQCDSCCLVCKRQDCIITTEVACDDCNMVCRNQDCYKAHKTKVKGQSQCETFWPTCKVLDCEECASKDHKCGEYQCMCCLHFVIDPHLCYQ